MFTVIHDFYCIISDAIAYSNAHYGQGTGPILLDNVACTGAEYNLTSCSYDSDTSDCGHYEDAGVRCNTTCGYNSVVCVEMGLSKRCEMPHKVSKKFVHLWFNLLFYKCIIREMPDLGSGGKSSHIRLWDNLRPCKILLVLEW